jgi:hypothetical protein
MKISVVPRGLLTWCCVVAAVFLSVGHICQANQVDWTRYYVDGVQLTGNNDTRYLKADPVVDWPLSFLKSASSRTTCLGDAWVFPSLISSTTSKTRIHTHPLQQIIGAPPCQVRMRRN